MQDSYRTFTVCLKPAFLLYDALRVMKQMASLAVLRVQPGYVEIKANSEDSEDPKAIAALVMEDLSMSSLGPHPLVTVHLDLLVWLELLADAQNSDQTIWIYMNGDRHNLYLSIGNDSIPIELGEAKFVKFGSINCAPFGDRYIQIHKGYVSPLYVNLNSSNIWGLREEDPRCFAISLRTECLRKVISTCASNYDHVMMMVFSDTVVFLTVSDTLLFHTQDDDCLIGGVGEGQCLLVEWHGAMALRRASKITSHVLIGPLLDQRYTRVAAIQFNFEVDECNLLSFFMEAPDVQLSCPLLKPPRARGANKN